jgi:ABC-type uncharacterized transport system substrate-binding protein
MKMGGENDSNSSGVSYKLMYNIYQQPHINKHHTLLILITIFFLVSIFASADAFEVVAVKSSELKPYNDTLEGFRKACNCTVIEITEVEGQSLPKQISRISPVAVLAIGTDAFKKVKSIKDLPVIYTMVIPSEVDILLQKNISGVSMDISPETCLKTMIEIFPGSKRIGLIYDPQHTGSFVKEAVGVSRNRGVKIVSKIAHNLGDIPALIDEMKDKIDSLKYRPLRYGSSGRRNSKKAFRRPRRHHKGLCKKEGTYNKQENCKEARYNY